MINDLVLETLSQLMTVKYAIKAFFTFEQFSENLGFLSKYFRVFSGIINVQNSEIFSLTTAFKR